jgi:hypothetical protein
MLSRGKVSETVFFIHLKEQTKGPFVSAPVCVSVTPQELTVPGNRLRGEDPYVPIFDCENAVFILFAGGFIHESKVAGVEHPCIGGVVETISTSDRYRVVPIGL